jgi:hypothetical protein
MKPARIVAAICLASALLGACAPARADELLLRNGQKIVGTIVGYEKDMFRVETEYGIALVRKDKVVSIQISKPEDAKPTEAPKAETPKPPVEPAKPAPEALKHDAVKPSEATSISSPAAQATPPAPSMSNHPAQVATSESPVATPPAISAPQAPSIPAPVAQAKPAAPPPPPPSHPVDVPMPAHLEEHVDGNTYFSDTFQFSMFKPPDWKIYEGVPKETGSGIMAMGADDEQTLLIVDRQVWSGVPKLTSDQVEARLRQTYQDYQRVSEQPFQCDGQTATRRTFTGVLDGAEWHGVAVHVIHGNMVFGIIGLTSAETYQFQEAIFNKIIRTFHFLAPTVSALGPAASTK